ncbi:AIR synthase related protein [Conexibacter sp. CPCC 206217]|uniref:AIR synthase related protein n=1 Tax=Conexibacter sp. CPCC 206217 TaxID=3064574 RepID=UPI002716F7EF|nr:AIR synthase related protein [Conexibacter sp. CPCC 206217]MDO8212351.1 AIR synthase related protein [Conexibacter sp. CPCC 206217]
MTQQELDALAAAVRDAPGLDGKRDLDVVAGLDAGIDGDDGALVGLGDAARDGEQLVVCGEAIAPSFLAADPFAAGAAAVVTNVSDVRAMGGRPLAIVDMLVSPDRAHAERVLGGLRWASQLLGVPVVGGHTTIGHAAALSASCTGIVRAPLRAAAARPGDVLLAAFALEGRYANDTSFFFSSLRDRPAQALGSDGDALVEVAEAGLCHAARDVSMPGAAGSLLQLVEVAGCGAVLDVERLPRPGGVPLERWLLTFPSFGFLLAAPAERVGEACAAFTRRGLACAPCGAFEAGGVLRLASGELTADVWNLAHEPLTRLTAT